MFTIFTTLFASTILSQIAAFIKPALEIVTVLFKALIDFIVWYAKEFWTGLGVIFHNLSTLTVLLAVLLLGGWYFKTWDNDKVLQQCINTCPTAKVDPKKYYHPLKQLYKKPVRPQPVQRSNRQVQPTSRGIDKDVFSGN